MRTISVLYKSQSGPSGTKLAQIATNMFQAEVAEVAEVAAPPEAMDLDTEPAQSGMPYVPKDSRVFQHFKQKLQPTVEHATDLALEKMFEEHAIDANDDMLDFEPGERLKNKIVQSVSQALRMHGMRKPLVGNTDCHVPWEGVLERHAPGVPERIKSGEMDVLDIANGNEVGVKRVPAHMVEDIFHTGDNTSQIASAAVSGQLIPYNKILPFSAKEMNAARYGVRSGRVKGDQSRGVTQATFWETLSPPHGITHAGESGGDMSTARFSLPTAVLNALNFCSQPRRQHPDDSWYCEHPQNTLGLQSEEGRFSMHGSAYIGCKHISEVFNGIVQQAHGNPRKGSDDPRLHQVQKLIFKEDDVQATLAAISLALKHQGEKAEAQTRLFFANRETPNDTANDDIQRLRRPVCHLKTPEAKAEALQLLADFHEGELDNSKQDKDAQRARQSASDKLRVHDGLNFQFGQAHDVRVKHTFEPRKETRNFSHSGKKRSGSPQRRHMAHNQASPDDNWRRR